MQLNQQVKKVSGGRRRLKLVLPEEEEEEMFAISFFLLLSILPLPTRFPHFLWKKESFTVLSKLTFENEKGKNGE